MGNQNDFQQFSQTFRNERESLQELTEEGRIDQTDHDEIDRFLKDKTDIEVSTLAEYLKRIRLTAKRAEMPLTKMTHDDLQDLFFQFTHGDHPDIKDAGLGDNTMRNYRKALRIFFTYLDRDWADDITVGAPVKTRISEDDILKPEDIEALLKASTRPRDTALVEFMADTAARLSMVGSLRLADLNLDGDRTYYTPNPNASGLKGAPNTRIPSSTARRACGTTFGTHIPSRTIRRPPSSTRSRGTPPEKIPVPSPPSTSAGFSRTSLRTQGSTSQLIHIASGTPRYRECTGRDTPNNRSNIALPGRSIRACGSGMST